MHHFGIACSNIRDKAREVRRFLGRETGEVVYDSSRDMLFAFIELGGCGVELIQSEKLQRFEQSSNPYHVCFEVSRIDDTMKAIKEAGGLVVVNPEPAILFGNRRVAFAYTAMGLIELLEK